MGTMRLPAISLLMAVAAGAQTAAGPVFEAATIKPNRSGSGSASSNTSPRRITAVNCTLSTYIQWAWELPEYRVSGPEWLKTERYDLNAKNPDAGDREAVLWPALRALLVERFQMKFHSESREMPVLALVLAKGGSRMKRSAFSPGQSSAKSRDGKLEAVNIPMSDLASRLARELGRPVLDMTGLDGGYDLTLEWVPEQRAAQPGESASAPPATGPSVFTALQEQLGLKLEPRRAQIDVLVIDKAEKAPLEN